MTDTERYVNVTCERIMASGHVRLYRDLYKDLREKLPCGVACRLIAAGLAATRHDHELPSTPRLWGLLSGRACAIAALRRLERYAARVESPPSGVWPGTRPGWR